MFDVGFFELIIIGLVGLLVLGPDKLIQLARYAGRMLGKWRRQFADMKEEIDREIRVDEMRKQLAKEEAALRESMKDATPTIHDPTPPPTSSTDHATGQSKTP
jgi:sec-independent protein translocase protein TatB